MGKLIGMYIQQDWPGHHPYSPRTWNFNEFKAYLGALRQLGYNSVQLRPLIEIMPKPLTESDRAQLSKLGQIITAAHELGLWVLLTVPANVVPDDGPAGQATYEDRQLHHSARLINPADKTAVQNMLDWRGQLLKPLAQADALVITDSDPGGYPRATNRQFINLLAEHRKMLDRLRAGIELIYWVNVGWAGACHHYQTNVFRWSIDEEFEEALMHLAELDLEPWGLANAGHHAEQLGLQARTIDFRHGAIEAEASLPLTNFGSNEAWSAGNARSVRGVMGNAQTHCVQLPNTFAFARGACGQAVTSDDYVSFADQLIPEQGWLIVQAWEALAGSEPGYMMSVAEQLAAIPAMNLMPGPLNGLLFGAVQRFVFDLRMQLALRASLEGFCAACDQGHEMKRALRRFVDGLEAWQRQQGYEGPWTWPGLQQALGKLNSAAINAVLDPPVHAQTPFGQVTEKLQLSETFTPRLIQAMKQTFETMA